MLERVIPGKNFGMALASAKWTREESRHLYEAGDKAST